MRYVKIIEKLFFVLLILLNQESLASSQLNLSHSTLEELVDIALPLNLNPSPPIKIPICPCDDRIPQFLKEQEYSQTIAPIDLEFETSVEEGEQNSWGDMSDFFIFILEDIYI